MNAVAVFVLRAAGCALDSGELVPAAPDRAEADAAPYADSAAAPSIDADAPADAALNDIRLDGGRADSGLQPAPCARATASRISLWSPDGLERAISFMAFPARAGPFARFDLGGSVVRFDPEPGRGEIAQVSLPGELGASALRGGRGPSGLVISAYLGWNEAPRVIALRPDPLTELAARPLPVGEDGAPLALVDFGYGPNGLVLSGRPQRSHPEVHVDVGRGRPPWIWRSGRDTSSAYLHLEAGVVELRAGYSQPIALMPFDFTRGEPRGEPWSVGACAERFDSTAPRDLLLIGQDASGHPPELVLAVQCWDELRVERRRSSGELIERWVRPLDDGAIALGLGAGGHLLVAAGPRRGDVLLHILEAGSLDPVRPAVELPIRARGLGQTRLAMWTDPEVQGRVAVAASHVVGHGAGDQEIARVDACLAP